MSDFESRVRDALRGVAGETPEAHGLAEGARRRARHRRRGVLAVSATAVAAAIAVPAALSFGGSDATDPVTRDPSPSATGTTEPAMEGRVETWRNLEIRVPDDWGYGNLSTWCAAGGSLDDRVVERPGGVVMSVACKAPQSGFGVQFFDPAAYDPAYAAGDVRRIAEHGPFPEGSWVGYQYAEEAASADAAVLVVAPTEQSARDVLDSARLVDGADGNGCRPHDSSLDEAPASGVMAICRYTMDGWLEQSEKLSAADTTEAVAALDLAPETTYAPPCPGPVEPEPGVTTYVVMLVEDTRYSVTWEGSRCADQGVLVDARERRELTEDVLYWALSPGWSGGVDGDVPLPGELRR